MQHVMLYCFKKDNNANDRRDLYYDIYCIYRSRAITIIRIGLRDLKLAILTLKDEGRRSLSNDEHGLYQDYAL